jgi:hypothetical protein
MSVLRSLSMSKRGEAVARLIAFVRALFRENWQGLAGKRFRRTISRISRYAEDHHVRPSDLVDEGITLGRRKVEGTASKELATAVRDFAEAEKTKIESELQRRSLESRVRKEQAEARLAELTVLKAEVDLLQTLKQAGVVLRQSPDGNLTVLPAPSTCDLEELIPRNLLPPGEKKE